MGKIKSRPLWLALACLLAPYQHAYASDIPLDIIQESGGGSSIFRLGINVGVNGGTPQEYLFDTGSDSFNIAVGTGNNATWFPGRTASNVSSPYPYLYGDGTYGYWQQNVNLSSIQFYNSSSGNQVSNYSTPTGLPVAAILDQIATASQFASGYYSNDTQGPVVATFSINGQQVPYYQDLSWQQNINQNVPVEEGNFYGTFGAGDFVYAGDNGGPPGMLTATGYIVEANGKPGVPGSCGQACFILGLTPALRAQFLSVQPWVSTAQNPNNQTTFGVSGAHAAQQFDTLFNYTLNNGGYTATLQTLFDSGTTTIFLNDGGLYSSESTAGHLLPSTEWPGDSDEIDGVTLSVTGTSSGSKPTSIITGNDTTGDQTNVVTLDTQSGITSPGQALYGVSFFLHNAVMYDLQNQATGYTPFYVTDAPITTGFTATAAMGPLGLAGVISGSGPFTVASGGIANLSGTNTYTGLTDVQQGGWLGLAGPGSIAASSGVQADGTFDISRVTNGAAIQTLSGTGTVMLGGNTLELTQASSSFSGQLVDGGLGGGAGGGLIVAGGTETLTGANTYAGLTGVGPHGMLLLDGSVAGSLVDAGVLAGNGHIGGDLAVVGTIAPGSSARSYQTLSVAGNYTQAAGSTYVAQWNLQQSGLSSQIVVNGKATLAAGAIVDLVPSGGQMFTAGARYTLLTAAQGLTGTYNLTGDTSLSAVLRATPFYDANHFYLDVALQRPLTAVAQTRNQYATLGAIQALPVTSVPFATVTNLQSDAQIRYAADQLSGEIHASLQNTFLEDSRFVRDAVTARLRQAGPDGRNQDESSGQQVSTQANGLAWWGQFVGSWGHNGSNGDDASLSHTLGGFLVGADMAAGSNSRIGIVSGYTQTSVNVNQRGSNASSDDVHLGIYAGTQLGAWGLSLGAAYTQHDFDTRRTILFPDYAGHVQSSSMAYTAQIFGEAAYRLQFKTFALEPFAQTAYVHLNSDGLQEQGGAMALSMRGDHQAVTYTTLGTHASTHFLSSGDFFTAHATMGWRHAFGHVQPDADMAFANGSAFTVEGLPIARNALVLDTGLDLHVSKRAVISLSYNGQIAAHAVDSGFKGGFTWQF